MANFPFVIYGRVTLSGSSQANAQVTIRNERTGDTQSMNTNSDGDYVLDCANFTSGYSVGDTVTSVCLYTSFEGSGSVTITSGGAEVNITLAAVATAAVLRYYDPQDVYDYMGYTAENDDTPSTQQVITMGLGIEKDIDRRCNTRFDSANAITNEYLDCSNLYQRDYYLEKTPIQTLTKFEVNKYIEGQTVLFSDLASLQADACDAITDWSASTDGAITLNTTDDQVQEGSGCLNITKTGGTTDNVTYSKTFGTTYDFNSQSILTDFYMEDTTEFATGTAVELRFGSDSSNYYYKQWNDTDFSDTTWKRLSFNINDATGTTGTPDRDACDYFAIKITYSASGTTVTASHTRLDDIRIGEADRIKIDLDTGRVRITSQVNYPALGTRMVRSTYTYGISSVPADITRLAVLMTAKELMLMEQSRQGSAGRGYGITLESLNMEIDKLIKNNTKNKYLT